MIFIIYYGINNYVDYSLFLKHIIMLFFVEKYRRIRVKLRLIPMEADELSLSVAVSM